MKFLQSVFAFIIRTYPDDYRRRITFVTLLGGLASTVFWPLTALLLANVGWRGALVGMALLQIAGCLVCYLIYLPRHATLRTPRSHPHDSGAPVGALLRSRPFVLLAISFTLQSLVLAGLAAHIIALFSAGGVGTAFGLLAASSIGVMQVLGRIVLLAAGSRLNPAATARVVGWLLPAAIITLLAVSISPWLAFFYAFLFGTGNGMMTIVKGTATADLISREHVAKLNGVLAMPMAIARAAGPILIASFWDYFGDPRAAMLIVFVLAGAAAISLGAAYRAAEAGRGKTGKL